MSPVMKEQSFLQSESVKKTLECPTILPKLFEMLIRSFHFRMRNNNPARNANNRQHRTTFDPDAFADAMQSILGEE